MLGIFWPTLVAKMVTQPGRIYYGSDGFGVIGNMENYVTCFDSKGVVELEVAVTNPVHDGFGPKLWGYL